MSHAVDQASMRIIMPAFDRPQIHYRQRLTQSLAAIRPAGVLEVGCGNGRFLRDARAAGIAAQGVDPDESCIAPLRQEGFSVSPGQAEHLAFADAAFDAVVFCYTAHHLEDWRRALHEALRVTRKSVLILDPWYDESLSNQRVAAQFDRWCKAIDRASGMVHRDCMDAGALLAPIAARFPSTAARIEYLLELQDCGTRYLDELAEEQLQKVPDRSPWRQELDRIRAEAKTSGFGSDGAVLVHIDTTGTAR